MTYKFHIGFLASSLCGVRRVSKSPDKNVSSGVVSLVEFAAQNAYQGSSFHLSVKQLFIHQT